MFWQKTKEPQLTNETTADDYYKKECKCCYEPYVVTVTDKTLAMFPWMKKHINFCSAECQRIHKIAPGPYYYD